MQSISADNLYFYERFVLGGIAGLICKTTFAPVEKMNFLRGLPPSKTKLPKNITYFELFNRVGTQKWNYFWKGNLRAIYRYIPSQALNFGFNGYFQSLSHISTETDDLISVLLTNVASGSLAGATSLAIIYPFTVNFFSKDRKDGGISNRYKGFGVSCLGVMVYRGIYFGLFNTVKPTLLTGNMDNLFTNFCLAYVTTTTAIFCAHPVERVRRAYTVALLKKKPIDATCLQYARIMLEGEGIFTFFRGVTRVCSSVSMCSRSAGVLAIYELLRSFRNTSY